MTLLAPRASTEIPLPVARWLEVAWPVGLDTVDSVQFEGPVRVRRRRVWLRGDCTMRVQAAQGYVSDIRLGFGPLTTVRGLDAFVDGRGIMAIGRETTTGAEIDHGGFIALWALSILFPSCWSRLPGLRWTPIDDAEALVALPFRGGIETATIRFKPDESSFPTAIEAERQRVPGGPKVSWRAEYGDWHWRSGLALPTRLSATWGGDATPWFDLRIDDVIPNAHVRDDLDRANGVIEAHLAAAR